MSQYPHYYQQPYRKSFYIAGHILLYLGLILVILSIGWVLAKGVQLYSSYQQITRQVATLEASGTDLPVPQLRQEGEQLLTEIVNFSEEAKPLLPVATTLGWVPTYGPDLEALPTLVAISEDISRAGLQLNTLLDPIFEEEVNTLAALPLVMDGLAEQKGTIQATVARLQTHQAALNTIDTTTLSPSTAPRVAQLQERLPELISGLQVATILPELLGSDAPKTYLVLTQNADEIRPSGGYINTAGHLTIQQGQIREFIMQDSYAVDNLSPDYPYPPQPIYQYMAADYWVLRDASWFADFPTTAQEALTLYEMGQGISADGVIAVDQHALAYILRGFQPLPVDGEQVTSENVISLMRQRWAPDPDQDLDGEWWLQRKSFMLELSIALQQTVEQDFQSLKLSELVRALQQALQEKHLLVYLNEPASQTLLNEQAWDGALQSVEYDYLMVVEANLGFNKASAAIERQLEHQVLLDDEGGAQAQTRLIYRHPLSGPDTDCEQEPRYEPVYEQNMARCYWNYGQLLVPAEAQLVKAPNQVVEGQYLLRGEPTTGQIDQTNIPPDKISWGQLVLLRPSENLTLEYTYTLPPDTAKVIDGLWHYTLYLQKQPGMLTFPAEITIVLPEGARLVESGQAPTEVQAENISYSLQLQADQQIDLTYRLP